MNEEAHVSPFSKRSYTDPRSRERFEQALAARSGGRGPESTGRSDGSADKRADETDALWEFVQHRQQSEDKLQIQRSASGIRVQILTDDRPFLVDSVRLTLASQGASIRRHLHPILRVRRDHDGRLIDLDETGSYARANAQDGFHTESLMQITLDRVVSADRILDALRQCLSDVILVVAAWKPMLDRLRMLARKVRDDVVQTGDQDRRPGEVADFLNGWPTIISPSWLPEPTE